MIQKLVKPEVIEEEGQEVVPFCECDHQSISIYEEDEVDDITF